MTVTLHQILLYAGALAILWVTPGPVWLAVIARGLSGGFAAAWPVAVGVTLGDLVWPLAAILGIAWIAGNVADFMLVMRWVAAAIFVAMGAMLLRHAGRPISADSRLTRPGTMAGLAAGVLAVLGNPKAILFYMGVLPGFFDLGRLSWPDVVLICLVSVAVPLLGNLGLALFVGRARALLSSPRALWGMNVSAGVLLLAVGVAIPLL